MLLQYVADRQGFGVKKNKEAHNDAGEHRPREPAALQDETEEAKKEGLGKRGEPKTMTTTMGESRFLGKRPEEAGSTIVASLQSERLVKGSSRGSAAV